MKERIRLQDRGMRVFHDGESSTGGCVAVFTGLAYGGRLRDLMSETKMRDSVA